MDRFQRFTDRARHVLTFSDAEARALDHDYVGTEHLLLGLVRETDGVAARVLVSLGADLGKVRTAVEFIIGRGPEPVTKAELALTPRTKRVIELAIDEARRLGHDYIGTEHLLLGLVREGEGIAAGVLESLGVNLDRARHEVIATLLRAGAIGAAPGGVAPPPAGRRYVRFEDWTPAARAVLVGAQRAAEARGGASVDTQDLLLGAVADRDRPGIAILALLGAGVEQVRSAVAEARATGEARATAEPGTGGEPGLTLAAKEVLALAEGEASRSRSEAVGVGHVLVALAMLPTTTAGQALAALGITSAGIREVIAQVVDERADDGPSGAVPPGASA